MGLLQVDFHKLRNSSRAWLKMPSMQIASWPNPREQQKIRCWTEPKPRTQRRRLGEPCIFRNGRLGGEPVEGDATLEWSHSNANPVSCSNICLVLTKRPSTAHSAAKLVVPFTMGLLHISICRMAWQLWWWIATFHFREQGLFLLDIPEGKWWSNRGVELFRSGPLSGWHGLLCTVGYPRDFVIKSHRGCAFNVRDQEASSSEKSNAFLDR